MNKVVITLLVGGGLAIFGFVMSIVLALTGTSIRDVKLKWTKNH